MASPATIHSSANETDLFDRSIAVEVTFKIPSDSRKVDANQIETDAEKDLLRLSKKLFVSKEYKAIRSFDRDLKKFLRQHSVPSPFLREATYLVPLELFEQVHQRLEAAPDQRRELVAAFIEIYPTLPDEMLPRLASLGDEADYLSAEMMSASFSMGFRYVEFGVPKKIKSISQKIFKREMEKAAIEIENARELMKEAMFTEMAKLVQEMVKSLTPGEDGKPRKFYTAVVDNMNAFLDNASFRNLTSSQELSELVDQARGLLLGLDAQTIKKEEALKDALGAGFKELSEKLNQYVTVKGGRKITFDEDV